MRDLKEDCNVFNPVRSFQILHRLHCTTALGRPISYHHLPPRKKASSTPIARQKPNSELPAADIAIARWTPNNELLATITAAAAAAPSQRAKATTATLPGRGRLRQRAARMGGPAEEEEGRRVRAWCGKPSSTPLPRRCE